MEESDRQRVALVVAVAAYVAAALVANVMSVRAVRVAGYSIDAGTLTYPLTFTLRDVIHKVGGRTVALTAIVATAAMNALMALAFWVGATLPADPAVGPQREFGQVLVGTWRIVAASIVAQIIAELLDTEAYQRFVRRFGRRAQWGRVLVSNALSIPVDSALFVLVAFAGTAIWVSAGEIVVSNIVVKGATTLLTWPLIYAVRDRVVPASASG